MPIISPINAPVDSLSLGCGVGCGPECGPGCGPGTGPAGTGAGCDAQPRGTKRSPSWRLSADSLASRAFGDDSAGGSGSLKNLLFIIY